MIIKIVEYFKISRSYLIYSFILQFLLFSGCGANQKLPKTTTPSNYTVKQKTLSGSELYSLLGSKSNCDHKNCTIAVEVSKNQRVKNYADNNSFLVSFNDNNANDDTHYEFLVSDSDSNFSNYSSYSSLAKQGYNSTFSDNHQAIINYSNASYLLPATFLPGIIRLSTKELSLLILSTGVILTGIILASSGLNEKPEFQKPKKYLKPLSPKPDLKKPRKYNNQGPSPKPPIFRLPEEKSGNKKSNPNKHLVRLNKSQLEQEEEKQKYISENLPSFSNKRPLDDLLLFDQKLANLTSYKLSLKNNSNTYNQLSFQALELLNKKLFDYYESTNEELFQNLNKIFGLNSQGFSINISVQYKLSFDKNQRRTFALWLYKNNDPLAVALALKLLTNDDIDTGYLAKLFNSSHQQVLSSKASAAKFISYNYFAQDLFKNIHSIEKIADYMLIKFSSAELATIKDLISLEFYSQIFVHKFLERIYTFIDFYKLDATDLAIFLTEIIKFSKNNSELKKAISRGMNLKNPENAKGFENKKEIMEQAFAFWILAKYSKDISYKKIENVSNYFDEALTNFERILYPKKDIKFVFNNNKSSIRYRSDNLFSHKMYVIYNNLIKDHPNLMKDYPSDVIKNLIIMQYIPKPANINSAFAKRLNIDSEKLISILQLIKKYSLRYRKLKIGRVIDNDDREYFSLLFKNILEFKGTTPIIQTEIIKNLIIDFHDNELKNEIEKVLFIRFILKHKQPSWPSLQTAVNLHKELFPDIIKYRNIFDPDLYKEQSLMETLKLTHKITASFVEYVALNTQN